ncbi:GH92 family glycosyl hydrolase [Persicirhabdus sediminis]|uniref:GH92 family glycosyl hydrolase n=1 Tax=Persicirhabdus sediminis TaxID=454144 RepID=A0A8J7MHW0_9BACT|nr:GH92 family glycosyl hydrolase [Persicirhabdus sediminis]MBK1792259.1 GH92 family glycosyl hydrolase [Persicirhabdus sediminis]
MLGISIASICTFSTQMSAQEPAETMYGEALVEYIDPIIGCWAKKEGMSHGLGKTFPGPCTPFGMVQLSPDTITGQDYAPGYCYTHEQIEGFSFARLSGAGWYGEFGNLQVMASTGEELKYLRPVGGKIRDVLTSPVASSFSHENESISAGYYSVMLDDYDLLAELTAAPRSGMLRFTFPEAKTSRIQLDFARRIGMRQGRLEFSHQQVSKVDDYTLQGSMQCSSKDGGWGRGNGQANYTMHFYLQFDRKIENWGFWDAEQITPSLAEIEGKNTGFYFEFPTSAGDQVMMKAGISFVSQAGAKANLAKDIPAWDFAQVLAANRQLWADELTGVAIQGGSEDQKTIFSTALYHAYIDPRSVSDYDGNYIGADNKVHQTDGFTYRSLFSGWDVFRSQFPMLTLVRPDIVNDEINSLLQMAQQSGRGYLPRWEMMNAYSQCMVGDPAVIVFAEAYLKGIRNFDVEAAYQACWKTVMTAGNGRGREQYIQLGYVPNSQSRTLELAYADYAVGMFAQALGKNEDAEFLLKRSMNYKNVYDPEVGNMRSRINDEQWAAWKGLLKGAGCVESNPYQQGWFVPHDVQGLINLMGGDEKFLAHLEPFFEKSEGQFTGWNLYYNHANEPVHHVPFLFTYAGKPWLTQKWSRTVMDRAYDVGVKGLCGNEDLGQMSAWYILSAMGIHPVDPVSGVYLVGSPLFDKVTVDLDPNYHSGKQVEIIAHNNSAENVYVQSLSLNGTPIEAAWLRHEDLIKGGVLEFTMGPEPNKDWGSDPSLRPPSLSQPKE